MKFLVSILAFSAMVYSQAVAVIWPNHTISVSNYQGGEWVERSLNVVNDAYRCSFDEDGILWVVGDGTFYRVDCIGYTDQMASIPGGHPCDISAHGEIVINPSRSNVHYYNQATDQWIALPMSGLGQAIEFHHDEDREIYLTHDAVRYGDSRVSSYNWDSDWYQYTYPMDLFGILDLTVQPNGYPIAMALAHDGYIWATALWTWDGEYWTVPGENERWYYAVDCSPNGNIAEAYWFYGSTNIDYNGVGTFEFHESEILDVAVSDYSITP